MDVDVMRTFVIAEYCFIFCLCFTTLILRYFIHRHKSVRSMWKDGPTLCVLLLLVLPMAFVYLIMAVLWIVAIVGAVDNEPRYAFLLVTSVLSAIALDYAYSSVTIAIFLQRIFYLRFPMRRINKFNSVIYVILSASVVAVSILLFVLIVGNLSPDERLLPPGCFSFNCLAKTNMLAQAVSSAVFSGVIVVTGSVMFYLVYRHRKKRQNETCVKMNTFTLYIFYVRLIFQTIPFLLDVTLSETAGIQLGKYVGPYGAIGAILDITTTTAVYYRMYRPSRQIVASTSDVKNMQTSYPECAERLQSIVCSKTCP